MANHMKGVSEIKCYIKLKNDRHIKPQSIRPSLFIYGIEPGVTLATTRYNKTQHPKHLQAKRFVPRTGLHGRVPSTCIENIWPNSNTGRPYSANCLVRGSESRYTTDDTRVIERHVCVRANQRGRNHGTWFSICDSICVPEEELSPVLLEDHMVKYIALSPGGMGFYAHIGALKMLYDTGKLKEVKEISGGSAGAMAALLFVICKDNFKLAIDEALETDLSELTKLNLRNFLTKYGFIDTSSFKSKFIEVTYRITGIYDPSFQELYEYNPTVLYITSYCLDTNKTCYFSVNTHPNQKVIDTLCGSISVPLIFSPKIIEGKHYIDGGVEEITPAAPFLGKDVKEICCIQIKFIENHEVTQINNIKDYITKIMQPVLSNRISYNTMPQLIVEMQSDEAFDFTMPEKKKIELFVSGYQSWH